MTAGRDAHMILFNLRVFTPIFLWLVILLLPTMLVAQDDYGCPELSNKKAIKKYTEALELPRSKAKESYELLREVTELEPEFAEAWYILADNNRERAETAHPQAVATYKKRALNYYEKVIEACPAFDDYYSYFFVADYYQNENNLTLASLYFKKYLEANPRNQDLKNAATSTLKNIQTYIDIIENPVPFDPQPVRGISSQTDEFLPVLSADGDFLFYTSRFQTLDKYTTIQKQVEQFTMSQRIGNDSDLDFSKGIKMPFPFNQGHTQGAASLTIDNNELFITICEFIQAYGQAYNNCDIYSSKFVNDNWTEFKNLGPNVNGETTWESQPSISADGQTLYFSSIRESNLGADKGIYSSDIYKTTRTENGNWTKAVNLGPVINTEGNEKSPFIHSDSRTLYFSSDGRIGVGGYDIYYSKEISENVWSQPKNIGYPINTEEDDLGLIVSRDGKKAFFSSNKLNGQGGWDIYSFDLHPEAQPDKVLFVKGQLTDEEGEAIQDAEVSIKSASGERTQKAMVDKLTGKYAVAVSYQDKEEFLLTVTKQDYAFTSKYFRPKDEIVLDRSQKTDISLKPLRVGVNVELNDILFDFNSDEFDSGSALILKEFAYFLANNPKLKVAIHGHTDNVGGDAFNLELSNRRAKAVEQFIIEQGIDPIRLESKGFGLSRPVASNDSEEGRALNRRTEFVILKK